MLIWNKIKELEDRVAFLEKKCQALQVKISYSGTVVDDLSEQIENMSKDYSDKSADSNDPRLEVID
ncbi:MAG: hypothetical protein K0R90_1744 [Oscillospiraceae bacterium]|jgi:uncharacterized coiled-coil protein SlyX|nr:hypothetical protein [Oscillospiraceae bacterium]